MVGSSNLSSFLKSTFSEEGQLPYNLTLDSTNQPTINGADNSGYLDVAGENMVYTKAAAADGAHVKLLDGGSLFKENSKGLDYISATFTGGTLKVLTGYSSNNLEFEYELTSGEATAVKGNSFKLISEGEVTITSLLVTYQCTTSSTEDSIGLRGLKLVYNEDNSNAGRSIAKELQEAFKVKYGAVLPVIGSSEAQDERAINIGFNNSTDENSFSVVVNQSSFDLVANDKYGEYEAARYLLNNIEKNDVFSSFTTHSESFVASESEFSIMSYNLRVANDGTLLDGSSGNINERCPRIAKNILDKQPDSVGVQEASDTWRSKLKAALAPNYFYVGLGRESDRTGEASGIFYNVNKVKLIESDTKWFSETPDVPGSHYDDYGGYNRIFTYAIFQRISDGKFYMHVNSHFDLTLAARLKDGKALKAFTDLHIEEMPVFATADYNADKKDNDDVIRWFLNNGYTNSIDDIKNPNDINTFPTEDYKSTEGQGGTIDYIFRCNKGIIFDDYEVLNYKVQAGNDTVPAPTSDHYPIRASGHFVEPLISYAEPYQLPAGDIAINNGYETFDGHMNFVSSISEYSNRTSILATDINSVAHNGKATTDPYRSAPYVGSLSGSGKYINYNFTCSEETVGDLVLVIATANPSSSLNRDTNISSSMSCSINGVPVLLEGLLLKCHDAQEYVEWTQLVIRNVSLVDGLNSVRLSGSLPNQYSLDVFTDCEVSAITEHNYSQEWEGGLEGHFHRCVDEGFEFLTTAAENHTFDSATGLCTVCGAKPLGELDLSANAVTLEEYDNKIAYVVNMDPNYEFNDIDLDKFFVTGDNTQGNFPCMYATENTQQDGFYKFYFDLSGVYPTATSDSVYVAPHLYYNGLPFDGLAGDIRNHYKDTDWETRYYTNDQYDASPNHNEAPMYMIEEGHDLTVGKVRARIIYKWSMFMVSMSWTEGTVNPTVQSTTKTATFFNLYVYKASAIGTWERTGPNSNALLWIKFSYSGSIRPETLSIRDGASILPLAGFNNTGGVVQLVFDLSNLPAGSSYSYFYAHLFKNGSAYNYAGVAAGDVKTSGSKSTSSTKKSYSNGGSLKAARAGANWYEMFEAYSMLLIGSKLA